MSEGIDIRFTCHASPVQADGEADGAPFYFRARYDKWAIEIGGGEVIAYQGRGPAEGWSLSRPYGSPGGYEAGMMRLGQAEELIRAAVALWRAEGCAHG